MQGDRDPEAEAFIASVVAYLKAGQMRTDEMIRPLETGGPTQRANVEPTLDTSGEQPPMPPKQRGQTNSHSVPYSAVPDDCPGVEECPLIPEAFLKAKAAMGELEEHYSPRPSPSALKIIRGEWRTLGMIAAPFGLAIALYFIPATKGELDKVRTDAASDLALVKTDVGGQLSTLKAEMKGEISALGTRVEGIKETTVHTQRGVDELLRRSSPPPTQQASTEARDATPAAPAATTHRASAARQRQPEKRKIGILGF